MIAVRTNIESWMGLVEIVVAAIHDVSLRGLWSIRSLLSDKNDWTVVFDYTVQSAGRKPLFAHCAPKSILELHGAGLGLPDSSGAADRHRAPLIHIYE
ncbi:MAG: hypothetical protein WC247_07150 [Porticoccaceae bacterium]